MHHEQPLLKAGSGDGGDGARCKDAALQKEHQDVVSTDQLPLTGKEVETEDDGERNTIEEMETVTEEQDSDDDGYDMEVMP